jgi:hypothetical protein
MRLQFEVSKEKLEELKSLMKKGEMKTYTELFNNGTSLVKWSIGVVEEGRLIVAYDEEHAKMRELVMPFLQNAAAKAPKRKDRIEEKDERRSIQETTALKAGAGY